MIFYTITLHRASQYYFHLLLWPYIALTSVSFLVFFMSHEVGHTAPLRYLRLPSSLGARLALPCLCAFQVGERLGFGITLILAIEVSKTVFSGMVPVCGEALWLELFSALNLIYCIVALSETCIVLFLAFHEDPHLLPPWFMELIVICMPRCVRARVSSPRVAPQDGSTTRSASAISVGSTEGYDSVTESNVAEAETSLASHVARSMGLVATEEPGKRAKAVSSEDAATRLSLFERYFMTLDADAVGSIPLAACYSWLTFTCIKSTPDEIWAAVNRANRDKDEDIIPSEFMEICVDLLWDVPLELLETLHQTAMQVVQQRGRRYLLYWNRVAKKVDRHARLWVPASYYSLLILLLNVDLRDEYTRPPINASLIQSTGVAESSMFSGIGVVNVTGAQVVIMLLVPFFVVLTLLGSCALVGIARRRNVLKDKKNDRAKAATRNFQEPEELISRVSNRISISRRYDEPHDEPVTEVSDVSPPVSPRKGD